MKMSFTFSATRAEVKAYTDTVNDVIADINKMYGTAEGLIDPQKVMIDVKATSAWQKAKFYLRLEDSLELQVSIDFDEAYFIEVMRLVAYTWDWCQPLVAATVAMNKGISEEMKASIEKIDAMTKVESREENFTRG